jgi:hypothetical protein
VVGNVSKKNKLWTNPQVTKSNSQPHMGRYRAEGTDKIIKLKKLELI